MTTTKKYCPYCMSPLREGEPCPACGLTEGSYEPAPYHLPPGTVLADRYLIGRVLGQGGFGITYIGCDLRLEMKVAIKEYFPTERVTRTASVTREVTSFTGPLADSYQKSKDNFLQDARKMLQMGNQPGIITIRDFFEENNTAYIVMEFVEGITLWELVEQRGGRIPAEELPYLIEPVFCGLSAMHKAGLIHRDISPDNMMVENGKIRLLDFRHGFAGYAPDDDSILRPDNFEPVELYHALHQRNQGPWTDVYALAATMFYCLTGRMPPASLERLWEDTLIPPSKQGVKMTEQQEQALLWGLTVQPQMRPQDMEAFGRRFFKGWRPKEKWWKR